MKSKFLLKLVSIFILLSGNISCNKDNINPNIPQVNIYYTIDPNSTLFLELNTVGGWIYLDEMPGIQVPYPSRGIIVYREDVDIFKAYERQPPNNPFECCEPENSINCSKLVVGPNYPFVKDTCNDNMYQLLDGSLFSGVGQYSLIQYRTFYNGVTLTISN
jgi:hypothetical protein